MTYYEKLKDPRWQRKRLEILQRDSFTCRRCWSVEDTLHVHHRYYVKGREPWDYPDFAYLTVCDKCHLPEQEVSAQGFMDWEIVLGEKFTSPVPAEALPPGMAATLLANFDAAHDRIHDHQ